jgi:II/X family phage/plasmid replication protein
VIDWLTLRVFCDAPVDAGRVVSFKPNGEIEWNAPKALHMEGSHSETVRVRRAGLPIVKGSPDAPLTCLEISGNPAKWFQGHNLFGSDDLPGLSRAFVRAVVARLGYTLTAEEAARIDSGLISVLRIDSTQSWNLGTLPRALSAARALASGSHFNYLGRGSMTETGTVYWKKNSRHVAGKAYCKGQEVRAHKLPPELSRREDLVDLAQGLVRFEFTFRRMALVQRGLDVVANWDRVGATPEGMHADLMSTLTISDAGLPDEDLERIPTRLRAPYVCWRDGEDLRTIYSRATFYRHRKALLPFGIDLASEPPAKRDKSNVIPLRVVFHAQPLSVPSWARGTPLYFEPIAA